MTKEEEIEKLEEIINNKCLLTVSFLLSIHDIRRICLKEEKNYLWKTIEKNLAVVLTKSLMIESFSFYP